MKITKIKNINIILFAALIAVFAFPQISFSAKLYFNPNVGEYQPGSTFLVDIKIDTEGECINTMQAEISFPKDLIESVDFSNGNSILTVWAESPKISQEEGKISFIGGIPGGYCGKISGDPGPSDIIGTLIIRVPGLIIQNSDKSIGEINFLDSSQVLLNDGLGTSAKLTKENFSFKISENAKDGNQNEWKNNIQKDNIPPEPFNIEIHQDSLLFDGKYYIIFSTVDKQTGMQEYLVQEGKSDFKQQNSPYLLEDQTLQSIIKVKAIDKAGNERVANYYPEKKPDSKKTLILGVIIFGIIFIVFGLILFIFIRKK